MARRRLGIREVPGMAAHPATTQAPPQIVFVPVPGVVVFCVCLLLIAACVVWCRVMWVQGKRRDDG